MPSLLSLAVGAAAAATVGAAGALGGQQQQQRLRQQQPPHIFFVLVDDLGWADIGPNRAVPTPEVATPTLDALVTSGVHLTRHYVHKMCTPTRTSVQSGRLPVHVSTSLANPEDPSCGIPRNMTGLATMLKQAHYKAHQVGKWDAGMATPHHTPQGRGYDSSLGYFEHKNDFWTMKSAQSKCSNTWDLWDTDRPAYSLAGSGYEEFVFRDRLLDIVHAHDPADPLLLFYTPHVAHCPLQVPADYLARFAAMTNGTDETQCSAQTASINPDGSQFACRAQYHAMVAILDENIKAVQDALVAKGMWDNTLMVFSSDNGGPVDLAENAANNFPLRGGKYSEFEGGVRAAAFVSGGFVPQAARGTTADGIIAIADWYGTFAALAGVDPTDHNAALWGLPPIDSVDVWPLVTGANSSSPRRELLVDANCLIQGDMKLLRGKVAPAGWAGASYPNASSAAHSIDTSVDCGAAGCLFNVTADPGEHDDLAAAMPAAVAALGARLDELKKGIWQNHERGVDACPQNVTGEPCACWMAWHRYGGFMGPYQEVPLTPPPGPLPPPRPAPSPAPAPAVGPGGKPCQNAERPPTPFEGQDVQLDTAAPKLNAKQQWDYNAGTGQLSLKSKPALCLGVNGTNAAGNPNVRLRRCDDAAGSTTWHTSSPQGVSQLSQQDRDAADYAGAADSGVQIVNAAFAGRCLDIQRGEYEVELYACAAADNGNQHFLLNASADGRVTVAGGARKGLAVAVC